MVLPAMLSNKFSPQLWGVSSASPTSTASSCCSFVCGPALSSRLAMTPLPTPTSSTSSKLHGTKKNYSAEWIDLLSPESYDSSASISLPGKINPPRSGAVSFTTPDNDKLFTFAGYAELASASEDVPPERYVVNDLWNFSPYQQESSSWGWTKVVQSEDEGEYIPGPRLATALAVLPSSTDTDNNPQAVLLGGWDPQTPGTGGVVLEDVSMLDLDSLKWTTPIKCIADDDEEMSSTVPGGPTSRHVAVPFSIKNAEDEDKGEGEGSPKNVICLHNHRCEDHVLLLSTTDEGGKDTSCAEWKHQATTGDVPSSRGLHCAATLTNKHDNASKAMVLFGGAAKDGVMSNEAFVLDVATWKWTKLDCGDGNDIPSPRAGACLCPLDEDTVILFGGATPGDGGLLGLNDVWTLNIDMETGKGKWQCLVPTQNNVSDVQDGGMVQPPGRNAANLCAIDVEKLLPKEDIVWKQEGLDEKGCAHFLLQGGWYPFRKTYNDVFLLRVSTSN